MENLNQETLYTFRSFFKDYVEKFSSDDPEINYNLNLKINHTHRVCKNIISIGKSIGLSEAEMLLAEAIALFHDIGRFRQFVKYRTFADGKSEDHALLGIKVLNETKILESISDCEKNIIIKAIGYHNALALPDDLDKDLMLYSKLIRDADKIDIFGILVEFYKKPDDFPHLSVSDAVKTSGYSSSIIDDILNFRNIEYRNVKTSIEMKLLRLSWVYDINFSYTFRYVVEEGFIEEILKTMPDTDEIIRVKKHLTEYLKVRMN